MTLEEYLLSIADDSEPEPVVTVSGLTNLVLRLQEAWASMPVEGVVYYELDDH